MTQNPLVSIMISTRNRAADLEHTLAELARQTYQPVELVVIDDASDESLEPMVRRAWKGALTFERMAENVGMCVGRTHGCRISKGAYVVQLDDDSHFTRPDDLENAVRLFESRPEIGIVAFGLYNGEVLPSLDLFRDEKARYANSFVGCAGMFRKAAIEQVGGYNPFFQNEWEDNELSLRFIKQGWAVYFYPSVLIHHHLSSANRKTSRTWMRGFRNKLWAIVMHMPAGRVPLEAGWVTAIAFWDAIRLFRPSGFAQGIWEFAAGLGRAMRLRSPMDDLSLRRYDALRFSAIDTLEEWNAPAPCGPGDLASWFRNKWWNRPRQSSFWNLRTRNEGSSSTVRFEHQFSPGETGSPGENRKS